MQAVFAGVDKADRTYDVDAAVGKRRHELVQRKQMLERDDAQTTVLLSSQPVQAAVAAWEDSLAHHRVQWMVLVPESATSANGATLVPQPDGSVLSTGIRPEKDIYTISARAPLAQISALRLEVLADEHFPHHGPGRQDNGNLHLSEIQLFAGDVHGTQAAWSAAIADFNQPDWGVERAIDGIEDTAWGIYPASRPIAHGGVRTEKQAPCSCRRENYGRIEATARRRTFDRPGAAVRDGCSGARRRCHADEATADACRRDPR